jgi:hypothetical protein
MILAKREREIVSPSSHESSRLLGVILCWEVQQIQPGDAIHFNIEFSGRAAVVPQPSPYGIAYTGGVANRL